MCVCVCLCKFLSKSLVKTYQIMLILFVFRETSSQIFDKVRLHQVVGVGVGGVEWGVLPFIVFTFYGQLQWKNDKISHWHISLWHHYTSLIYSVRKVYKNYNMWLMGQYAFSFLNTLNLNAVQTTHDNICCLLV